MANPSKLRLSVLDQSPVPEGATVGDALRNSIDLAQHAERHGYHRYWLAEHHGAPGLACASPEAIIGPVALSTSNIRVGSGGIMMPHYSPLKVYETFAMLGGMFPGRIDLGVGRAAGTTPRISLALQRDRRQMPPDDFREQLDELLGYIERGPADGPEPWLLGSSPQSAIWAANLGLPYAFADFINPMGAEIAEDYRDRFQPSRRLQKPRLAVAAWVICADTDEEAFLLSTSLRMMSLLLLRGRPILVPPVVRAVNFLKQEGFPPESLPVGRRLITGAPATVRQKLEALAKEYGADEILAVNIMFDHDARRRSYELLAGEMLDHGSHAGISSDAPAMVGRNADLPDGARL